MNILNDPLITKKLTPYIGSHLEQFSFIKEGFSLSSLGAMDISCNDLSGCIQTQVSNYTKKLQNLNNNMIDLSQNILNYEAINQTMLNPNSNKYSEYSNVLNSPPTLQDGVIDDYNEMKTNENTLFFVGSITLATLLIASILLAIK